MEIQGWGRSSVVLATVLVVVSAILATPSAGAASSVVGDDVALADSALRDIVEALAGGRSAPTAQGVETTGTAVSVEVIHHVSTAHVEQLVAEAGGTVTGGLEHGLLEARVPYYRLEALEAAPGIDFLQVPSRANVVAGSTAIQGSKGVEAVSKTAATPWYNAGIRGGNVKIGIVDYFSQSLWNNAVAAHELSAPTGTFCRDHGVSCSIWSGGSAHGQGVAEIIHDLAPSAKLYIATAETVSDLQAAVNYFGNNGVRIVSRSLTSEYDGPGDGTGPLADVVASAVSKGMTWFNSAGNTAGAGFDSGTYWRGPWQDVDADGWLEFAPGDELMSFHCWFANGFRWSDWGATPTDYDVYVWETPTSPSPEWTSERRQELGATPLEPVRDSCNSDTDADYLGVQLHSPGSGTAGDVLEFMTNGSWIEHWQNAYSASGPVSDSNSAGALTIGAVDPAMGSTIAGYSSRGPTNDERIKPDLSAAACISSYTYQGGSGNGCFNGTSAATPVAAGVAALVRQRFSWFTPAQVKTWLLTKAFLNRGIAGPDNTYGVGEIRLPPPNDMFAKAAILTGEDGATTVNNVLATKEAGEPNHAGQAGGASIWWRWEAPRTGVVTIATAGSGINTVLGVYTGTTIGGLVKVAANNDVSASVKSSKVTFTAIAGRIYRIAVDGVNNARGTVKLSRQM